MKKTLAAVVLAAAIGGAAMAQFEAGPPPPPGMDPGFGAAPPATTVDVGVAVDPMYAPTGWDSAAILLAGGGLAAGSLVLKGALRKRS
jgi:hypothetical protein